jgi:RNA polymerase sigma factor (sigma-70 family)
MANRIQAALEQVRALLETRRVLEQDDAQLLERFLNWQDEAAFTALVRRHGPMVLGVCRRVLGGLTDAEDAFQVTFLTLACKARTLRRRPALGSWLYRVGYHIALRARSNAQRRRAQERQTPPVVRPDPEAEASWRELLPILDDELNRLPEKLRAPLVVCCLEGKTNEEAARVLGWPLGSVSKRLARGRELLRQRLARHSFVLAGAGLAVLGDQALAAVPLKLADTTVGTAVLLSDGQAAGAVSTPVAMLFGETMKGMLLVKLKVTAAIATLVLMLIGAGLLARLAQPAVAQPPAAPPAAAKVSLPEAVIQFEHSAPVIGLAFSPDGRIIASGGGFEAGCIRLWDIASGKKLCQFGEHDGGVSSIAFSPDARFIASGGWGSELILWDAALSKEVRRFEGHKAGVTSISFAPNGRLLLPSILPQHQPRVHPSASPTHSCPPRSSRYDIPTR